MRTQKFGIEIEMTGITRAAAAQVIAGHFDTTAIHVGGMYDAFSVRDSDSRQWKVVSDSSIRRENRRGQSTNLDAMYGLGKLYLQNGSADYAPEKAVKYLTVAAERGHESAQYLLGKTYLKGEDVPQDLERGTDLLKRVADRGNPFAQYTLGKTLLEQALPVQTNPIQLLTASADQGFVPACYLLGKIYLHGTGVAPDRNKAISYPTIAAEQGNQYAAQLLEKMNNTPNYHGPVAASAFRLLQQVSQIIQNEIQPIHLHKNVDRKLRRKINEKKQAQGLRQG